MKRKWSQALPVVALALLVTVLVFVQGRDEPRGSAPVGWHVARDEPAPLELAPADELADLAPAREHLAPSVADASGSSTDGSVPADTVELRVRVTEWRTDQPLEGARVQALDGAFESEHRTDAEGRVSFPVRDSDEWITLEVEKGGYCGVRRSFARHGTQHVTLPRAAALFGRVLDEEPEEPIADAVVSLLDQLLEDQYERDRDTTDESGRYELADVPLRWPNTYVTIAADGYPTLGESFEVREEGERIECDFRLPRGIEVRGAVVDAFTGAGVRGARLSESLSTGPGGSFQGRVLPDLDGSWTPLVQADGYVSRWGEVPAERLTRGEELLFRLPPATTVEGTVTDETGTPLSRGHVMLRQNRSLRREHEAQGEEIPATPIDAIRGLKRTGTRFPRTDEEGRYRITGVVPWLDHVALEVQGEELRAETVVERLAGPGETTRVDIVLPAPEPPTGGHVATSMSLNGERCTLSGTIHWTAESGASGASAFGYGEALLEVEAGRVDLRVELDGIPGPLGGGEASVHVTAGRTETVRFDVRLPTSPITGRIVFENGEPAAGKSVKASCPQTLSEEIARRKAVVETASNEQGEFALEVPELGRSYRVSVRVGEAEREVATVWPGTRELRLVVPRTARLRFRTLGGATERSVQPWKYELRWRAEPGSAFRPTDFATRDHDLEGWREVELPVGRVDLLVEDATDSGMARCLRSNVLVVAEGEPTEVVFVLVPGLAATFELEADQDPLPDGTTLRLVEEERQDELHFDATEGRWVDASRVLGTGERAIRFDDASQHTVEGLAPGRYRIKAYPPHVELVPAVVDVEPGMETVRVRWRRRRP